MKPRAGATSIVVALTLHEAQETLLLKKQNKTNKKCLG
jgi:hypothetical protein